MGDELNGTGGAADTLSPPGEFTGESVVLDTEVETHLEQVWNRVRHYGFTVGGWNFVLPEGLYSEVLVEPSIAALPNSPAHFLGLTNVRGSLVPVYRLEPWLTPDHPIINPHYALLAGDVNRGAALVVDNKPRVLEFEGDPLAGAVLESLPSFLHAVVTHVWLQGDTKWYLLDHQALFKRLSAPASHDK